MRITQITGTQSAHTHASTRSPPNNGQHIPKPRAVNPNASKYDVVYFATIACLNRQATVGIVHNNILEQHVVRWTTLREIGPKLNRRRAGSNLRK